MTTQEFSDSFDTLLSSYASKFEFGEGSSRRDIVLDEYEKSVLLTQSQEAFIIDLYSGRNVEGLSFEKTEEVRRYLSSLVRTTTSREPLILENIALSPNSVFFPLPKKALFIIYEAVGLEDETLDCSGRQEVLVTPIAHDEFQRVIQNPFRQPNDKRVLRLNSRGNLVEIVSKYHVVDYIIRYVSKPQPIVLTDLSDGLTIEDVNTVQECELHPVVHRIILNNAVQLALQSKLTGINNK